MEEEMKETQAPETPAEEAPAAAAPAPKGGFLGKVDNYFGITKSGSTFKTEIVAGLTTFMAMVYILMVNAGFFSALVPYGAAYIATAIGAIAGTMLMALLAKMPLAQASGMGVNAFVVYTLCFANNLTYANAMVFTLLDGVIFVILTATGLRKKIFEAIPAAVRHAIPVGIGLFIAFIGMQNAGVIVGGATLVELVSFNVLASGFTFANIVAPLVALLGVLAIAIMSKKNVKGSILWGILGSAVLYYVLMALCLIGAPEVTYTVGNTTTTISYADYKQLGEIAGLVGNPALNSSATAHAFFENITFSNPFDAFGEWGKNSVAQVFIKGFDFSQYLGNSTVASLVLLLITTALSLCMIDMFDTIGTLYGACAKGNLLDKDGVPLNMNKMMLADAVGTCVGAIAGTSTVTTFVESSSGVSAGGKTGFTALVTAILFALAMFLSPIAQLIPSAATASALIWVGVLMMTSVVKIDWTDPAEAIVAFLTFIVMVLGYSISKGIGMGIIAYILFQLFTGKVKEVSLPTWVIGVLFLATFLVSSM